MKLWGRKTSQSAQMPTGYAVVPTGDGPGLKQMGVPALNPPVPVFSQAGIGGQAGWKSAGPAAPWQQIGAFDGSLLNQFPAMLPGLQLHSGREWGYTGYYTPTAMPVALGGLSQTTRPNNISGAQRYGSTFQGPIGPISAQANAAAVVAAQVKQSGLQAMAWAKNLTPGAQGGQ